MSQWENFSLFLGIYEDFTGKDCKLDEFWDKRWINKMAYRKTYDILKDSLAQVKKVWINNKNILCFDMSVVVEPTVDWSPEKMIEVPSVNQMIS